MSTAVERRHYNVTFTLLAVAAVAYALLQSLVAPALLGIVVFVPESPVRTPGRIDYVGGVLLAAWLVALLVPVSEGASWGWTSARTLALFAAASVLIPVWSGWSSAATRRSST